jgi:hypothetical protein
MLADDDVFDVGDDLIARFLDLRHDPSRMERRVRDTGLVRALGKEATVHLGT